MTTMTMTDYCPPHSAVILRPNFANHLEESQRTAAGAAAFNRAIQLGYCNTTAAALRRRARADWFPGEDPQTTALRIVARMPDSATVPRQPTPKGAA